MKLTFRQDEGRLGLDKFNAGGVDWLWNGLPSGLFAVTAGGRRLDSNSMTFTGVEQPDATPGVRHIVFAFRAQDIAVAQHLLVYEGEAVIEMYPVITNHGGAPVRVERVDSIDLCIVIEDAELLSYTGNWGSEFEPQRGPVSGAVKLESCSGRSSKGNHPWFALFGAGGVLSASVAWSGNWALRLEPQADGLLRISGGLNDWEFFKDLGPGESMEGAPVVMALGADLNAVSQQYARVGRRHWYPRNALSARQPVEWNHWWPYEDAEINEEVFLRNAAEAQKMGFEVCTLDAGWFGPSDAGTFWEHYRGDWHLVNDQRFPNGIRKLADEVHARGMKFGIWCEIEGLGPSAQVAVDHPEYVAMRGGERLGCVCFGCPQVQEWAYATLSRLITEYGADWIKVDYNLDQGAGCDRTDHGHQAGDGLYEHYRGYYRVLERVRENFPEVVLENCSSGGLRIDLGMLRRTYMTFLSDPDWAVHDLQIFWGASTMLAPDVLLHWTYSHWRHLTPPPYQTFNPHDPQLTRKKWDYYSRISMLGLYGLSQKLPDLPEWMAKRIVENNAIYQGHVRRFVREADLYRLTDQPRRSGEGERWAAFQYSLPDQSEHLLFVFRMPGAERERAVRLLDLEPERVYSVDGLEGEFHLQMTGRALMEEGLAFTEMDEEESTLLKIA